MKLIGFSIALFLIPALALSETCKPSSILKKIFIPGNDDVGLEVLSVDLRHMDKKLIEETQNGKHFFYWVDDENQIHFSKITQNQKNSYSFVVIQDQKSKDAYIIKESGYFYFNPEDKKFVFDSKNSWDLQAGEIDEAIREQSNLKYTRKNNPAFEKTRVMNCTEVMAAQQRAENFLMDSVISSAAVTISSFVTIETLYPTNTTTKEKLTLLSADLLGNTISSAISSKVVNPLIVNKANIFTDFTHRTAADLGTNFFIKKTMYNALSDHQKILPNEEKLGNKILPYDTGFGIVRFFPKRALERATVYTLPKLLIESCLKNSATSFMIGPRTVRIVDRYAWGLAYITGRNIYFNQKDEEKQK